MLTFVLSLVSSGSQNVYHCSKKHIQTLQNLESQAREYPSPPPSQISFKEQAKNFSRSPQKFSPVSLARIISCVHA